MKRFFLLLILSGSITNSLSCLPGTTRDATSEAQALGNINSLITSQSTNLTAPLANLTTTMNSIAQNLANIPVTSTTNYNSAVTAINNFLQALSAQTPTAQQAALYAAMKTSFAGQTPIINFITTLSTTPTTPAGEQQALSNILTLIPQVNLSDTIANLTTSINSLAQNLALITANSTRYTPAASAINAFLDALIWQTVTNITAQNSQATNAATLLPLLQPIFTLIQTAFAAQAVVITEINKLLASAQQYLTWFCQANAAVANAAQATTLNATNTNLQTTINTNYQNLSVTVPDYYLLTLASLTTAKEANISATALLGIYTALQTKVSH